MALSSALLALARVNWQLPLPVAIALCLAVGTAAGLANGFITVRWAVPSFIVTLGMLEIARGGAYLVTGSRSVFVGAALGRIGVPLPGLDLSPAFLCRRARRGGRPDSAVENRSRTVHLCRRREPRSGALVGDRSARV